MVSSVNKQETENDDLPNPRSELDSHANMVVLGRNTFIFDSPPKRTCDVQPFDPNLGAVTKVPIVDGAVAYDCPFTHKTYILIFRNALHLPSLHHNLLPPFILREAGLIVNETAKIHCHKPTNENHAIISKDPDLIIPLQLNGIFSFFHTRTPTEEEMESDNIIFFTPDAYTWNPYQSNFAREEENMTGWNNEINYHRKGIRNEEVSWDLYQDQIDHMISSLTVNNKVIPSSTDGHESAALMHSEQVVNDMYGIVMDAKMGQSIGSMLSPNDYDDEMFFKDDPMDDDGDEGYETVFDGKSIKDVIAEVASTLAGPPERIDKKYLSKIWRVKEMEAEKALEQSTILMRKGTSSTLSRRFPTNDRMLRYRRLNSHFFTDTFFSKSKSIRGFTCAQLFVSDKGFIAIYFMTRKGQFREALHMFCKEVGVPLDMVCDPSGEQTSNDVKTFCNQIGMTLKVLEESTQWANRAERYIGMFKESVRQDTRLANSPICLWDYCAERRARIHNVTPKSLFQLQGINPITATLGLHPDISNICQYSWYEWCYYREESGIQFPYQKQLLGRVLGPMKNEGNAMTQAILTDKGTVVPRRSIRHLTIEEIHSTIEQRKREAFDSKIKEKLGDSLTPRPNTNTLPKGVPSIDDFMAEEGEVAPYIEDDADDDGNAIYDQAPTDNLIHMQLLLPQGEEHQWATLKQRSKDDHGNLIGEYNDKPHLNTAVYDVEFSDGMIREYSANAIAESISSQVNGAGYQSSRIVAILDFDRLPTAIPKSKGRIRTKSGQMRNRKTTAG